MTLQEFLSLCPVEIRLGQHFVNSYWKGSDSESQELYQLDGLAAIGFIYLFCHEVQWDTTNLPEPRRYWEN